MLDDNTRKMLELFFHYDQKRVKKVNDGNLMMAHYTSADTAMQIIKGRSLWLRNAGVMNDFSEVEYGRNVIAQVMDGPLGKRYRDVLSAIDDSIATEVIARYERVCQHAREVVFMASVSEHKHDDMLGRLSMWRAYGGPVAGVALIFKGDVVNMELDPDLEIAASPVLYGGPNEFHVEFEDMIVRLESEVDFLKTCAPEDIKNSGAAVLQYAIYSTKHLGFEEEQEWRLIHRPFEFSSAFVESQTVTISGTPQTIYKLPFHNPDAGFEMPQLDLNEILAGIIIGPCAYPETVLRAFKDELAAAKMANVKVIYSGIPLRQQW